MSLDFLTYKLIQNIHLKIHKKIHNMTNETPVFLEIFKQCRFNDIFFWDLKNYNKVLKYCSVASVEGLWFLLIGLIVTIGCE